MNSDAATGAASWRIPNVSLLVDGAPGSGRPPVDLCPKRSCTFLLDSGSSVGSSSVANVRSALCCVAFLHVCEC